MFTYEYIKQRKTERRILSQYLNTALILIKNWKNTRNIAVLSC